MKVLSIGTDRKLFESGSLVLLRSIDYASKMRELHVVVFSLSSQKLNNYNIGNLYIYPTNSRTKFSYVSDAIRIGCEIIKKYEFSINSSVITCQDPFETGLVGVFLKRKFHFPLQIQIHTDFLNPFFKTNFLNKLRVFISKFIVPKADGIRAVSSVISESLNSNFKNLKARIDVLPIWVDTLIELKDSVQLDIPKYEPLIFVASRLEQEKKVGLALEVFKRVEVKFPNAGMVIAGDGNERKKLENLKTELGIKNLTFLGWRNDVPHIFLKSDIFLLTSDYEGYAMTLMQAGSFGVPIVTTNAGLAKTDLFKNGVNSYVCPVGDVECLSNGIIDLITNEEKRKSFANTMRDNIRNESLTKDQYIAKYIDLLKKLLKS